MGNWAHGMEEWILGIVGVIIAYGFAVLVGHWMIRSVMRELREGCENKDRDPTSPPGRSHSAAIGCVERALYVTALLMGLPQFIGLWLIIKTAAQWHKWKDNRWVFNLFLIGNGLSIGFAGAGYGLRRFMGSGMWPLALLPILGACFGTWWLKTYIANQRREAQFESAHAADSPSREATDQQ